MTIRTRENICSETLNIISRILGLLSHECSWESLSTGPDREPIQEKNKGRAEEAEGPERVDGAEWVQRPGSAMMTAGTERAGRADMTDRAGRTYRTVRAERARTAEGTAGVQSAGWAGVRQGGGEA